jgi:hypothetical protein
VRQPGLACHVRIVAVLMIIQGVLECIVALGIASAMSFFPVTPRSIANVCVACMVSCVHITAGVRNYRFRGKVLGIAALACWQITSVFCFPTAFILAVYGVVVYLNKSASTAFRLGEAGHSADQILAVFQEKR